MTTIIHKELSYQLNGVLFDVHNQLGRDATEKQICDLIERRLHELKIAYKRELTLHTENDIAGIGRHRVDFLIDNKIILEIKFRRFLTKEDYHQVQRYLKTLNMSLGILINFRDTRLIPRRILNGGGKD